MAVLNVRTVRAKEMEVIDSRQEFCGHTDIKLMVNELINREKGEPLPPEIGKRVKDLKDILVKASTFVHDPIPSATNKNSRKFLSQIENKW